MRRSEQIISSIALLLALLSVASQQAPAQDLEAHQSPCVSQAPRREQQIIALALERAALDSKT